MNIVKIPHREWYIVWVLALILVLISLSFHYFAPSTMNQSYEQWTKRLELHRDWTPFKIRPLTTNILTFCYDNFQIPYKISFFVLHYMLHLLMILIFYKYLRILNFNHYYSLIGISLFGFSVPVILAHFAPIYTWSDFWMYLFIPYGFIYLFEKRYQLSVFFMSVSLLARETTIIFILIWSVIFLNEQGQKYFRLLKYLSLTALIFLVFRIIFTGTETGWAENRFNCFYFNFDNYQRIIDTLFSAIISFGFMWFTGIYQIFQKNRYDIKYYNMLRWGGLFTIIIFTTSTLTITLARETRLFFPPFMFIIPLTLIFIKDHSQLIKEILSDKKFILLNLISIPIFIGISIFITFSIFPNFEFRAWKDGNHVFLIINLTIFFYSVFLVLLNRLKQFKFANNNS